jgi:hypothetical protein
MKKSIVFLSALLLATSSFSCGISLRALNKAQFIKAFVNKTAVSIATDNLNGQTIANTFSMFLDEKGNATGKMSIKPADEPQIDHGVYSVAADGTAHITWQHWDGAKKLCFRAYNTANAYVNVGCDNVFHTAFMKSDIKAGNSLIN